MAGSKSVSFRPGPVFDRQGSPAWGLTVESMGKILDTLGCVLTVGKNRFALRPIGRPKKVVSAPEPVPTSSPPGRLGLGDAEEKDEVGQAHVQADLKKP
jgi:hypothetical protein